MSPETPDKSVSNNPVRVVIHSFFIVPFLIAVFGVLLFAMIKLVVGSPPSIHEALTTIGRGSETERWQAALDLASMLQSQAEVTIDQSFVDQLIFEYERSRTERKPYLRTYLALAMGLTGDIRFEPALLDRLENEDPAHRLAVIKALGLAGGVAAEGTLIDFLDEQDVAVVLESVVALGRLGRPGTVMALKPMLTHPEPNVRWDTAIALAKLGDLSGLEIINQLLDRSYFHQFPDVDEREQDRAISVALNMAEKIPDPLFKENLVRLSRSDPNLQIANAALMALKRY
ncbi:MAG: HEAT repeat domain-containing protein [Candidatus Marinimicrobia bacterium]|nr:HEAT repeat domain-containing protein [Candidatus Neomarinimicrobiota bacterium]